MAAILNPSTPASGENHASRRRFEWSLVPLLIFFIGWTTYFVSRDFEPGLRKFDDGPQYLLIGKSMAMGKGISNLSLPGAPDFLDIPTAFPLMLTAYWKLWAPDESPLCLTLAIAMGCGAWFSFLWAKRIIPPPQAYILLLAFTANPLFIHYATSIMTESPYALLLFSGLWLIGRDMEEGNRGWKGWKGWLALLAWLILFRLRVNTMPFLVIHIAVLAYRRQIPKAAVGASLALTWIIAEKWMAAPESHGYFHYDLLPRVGTDSGLVRRALGMLHGVWENFFAYTSSALGQLIFPRLYDLHAMNKTKRVAILILSAWEAWGISLLWIREPKTRPYLIAFAISWAPILLERTGTINRYLLPSLPLLFICLTLPLSLFKKRLGALTATTLTYGLVLSIAANHALSGDDATHWRDARKDDRKYAQAHDFINAANPKPDLLVTPYHFYSYIATGLTCIWYPQNWSYAKEKGLLDGKQRVWAFFPYSSKEEAAGFDPTGTYRLGESALFSSGDVSVYEVLPGLRIPSRWDWERDSAQQ